MKLYVIRTDYYHNPKTYFDGGIGNTEIRTKGFSTLENAYSELKGILKNYEDVRNQKTEIILDIDEWSDGFIVATSGDRRLTHFTIKEIIILDES